MRYQNKKGFFLIEAVAAVALLTTFSGIITWYIAAISSCHKKAQEQVALLRSMQQTLYDNKNNDQNVCVEKTPIHFSSAELLSKGYSLRFHEKLVVKRVRSTHENKKESAIELVAICTKDNNA